MKKSELKQSIKAVTGTKVKHIQVMTKKISNDYWGIGIVAPVEHDDNYGLLHHEEEAWGADQAEALENSHKIIMEQLELDWDEFKKGNAHELDLEPVEEAELLSYGSIDPEDARDLNPNTVAAEHPTGKMFTSFTIEAEYTENTNEDKTVTGIDYNPE